MVESLFFLINRCNIKKKIIDKPLDHKEFRISIAIALLENYKMKKKKKFKIKFH